MIINQIIKKSKLIFNVSIFNISLIGLLNYKNKNYKNELTFFDFN